MSEVTNEGQTDWQRIRLSKKFSTVSEPLPESEVSELCVLLKVTSADDGGEIRVSHTDEDETLDNSQISHRDDKPRIITRPSKIDTEADCHSTQSTNAFELGEAADRQEKLRSSMFNVHLEPSVEFRKFERRACAGWLQENGKLWRAEITSIRVMDDENSSTSSNSRRNVKIDNKVLEEKVKCSLEKGVPLKTITITDPSIIRPSSNSNSSVNLTVDEKVRGEDLRHKNSSKRLCDYQGTSLGVESGEQSLQTTRFTHRNSDNSIDSSEDTLILEIPSKTRNFGPDVVEGVVIIGKRRSRVVEQRDSVLSLKLKKKRLRPRGTLIPRYKSKTIKPAHKTNPVADKKVEEIVSNYTTSSNVK
ncbi:uncharacterized protein LOC124409061 [Diprion similis]|uniref:uncharacterized protein LOC124409061 n=1 Tax=Diprion similis TaxID=362088 RepID=UPI001EF98CFF|nr:uncharacterized protein LOC124409061 [Diprion similis]